MLIIFHISKSTGSKLKFDLCMERLGDIEAFGVGFACTYITWGLKHDFKYIFNKNS